MDTLRRLSQLTWQEFFQTGTKDPSRKTGLNCTSYDDSALRVRRPASVSQDANIVGFRMGQKGRIFGFRRKNSLHLLWIDPEHSICDG